MALPETTRAHYVGTGSDVVVILADGAGVTFANIVAGTRLPRRVSLVKATGTTAATIVGLV